MYMNIPVYVLHFVPYGYKLHEIRWPATNDAGSPAKVSTQKHSTLLSIVCVCAGNLLADQTELSKQTENKATPCPTFLGKAKYTLDRSKASL